MKVKVIMQDIQQLKNAYESHVFISQDFLHGHKTNNWLKIHGRPMRRKPFKRKFAIFDEFSNLKR